MRVLVTGSHGFIGSALIRRLREEGHDPVPVVRGSAKAGEVAWDPAQGELDPAALEGADAVVHLAGQPIGTRRWTASQKQEILQSRAAPTALVARAVAAAEVPVLVSASAVGWYGLRGDEVLTEESAGGTGFLAEVCRAWEAATAPAGQAGCRVVHLRTGIVLGRGGGVLARMLPLFRLGLGGRLGSGRQWWSWITMRDETGLILHALRETRVRGAMNATSPTPATNAEVTGALARALRRPAPFPVPRMALAALFGAELVDEVVLAGQRALPAVAEATGYRFEHPELDQGVAAVLAAG